MLIEHATCLTVCLPGLEVGWGVGVTHYKGVFQIKASSSFISVYFLSEAPRSCWRSLRISEHLSWRGSWDTRLALPRQTPTQTRPPFSASIQPHYTKTFHFALPKCRSPLVWLQHALIFILGRAVALVLAGARPLLPLLLCHITRAEMKSEWSCCLSTLKLFFSSRVLSACFLFRVLAFHRELFSFPLPVTVHYINVRKCCGVKDFRGSVCCLFHTLSHMFAHIVFKEAYTPRKTCSE